MFIVASIPARAQDETVRIDSLMSSLYKNDLPGAAIGVVKNGAIVFRKGYGVADLDSKAPITSSTNFNICSMTKQFTAFSILQLRREGKLALDDKLSRFFPEFVPAVADVVTVRELLTHSSGIVDHYPYVDRKLYNEFWDKDVLTAIQSVDSLYFTPGTKYRYSNTAFCLLSLIIQKLSGKTYPEYIRDHIFEPLGMDSSGVIQPNFRISDRALGYECDNDTFKISDANQSLFFSTMGDGGIYTSINDYLKWIKAIQEKRVLDPALVQEAQSAQFSIDSARHLSYGYGWFVAGSGNARLVYHTGSNGGFRTIVFLKPSERYAVVIFSNRTGIDLEDLVQSVNKIFNVDDKAFAKLETLIS